MKDTRKWKWDEVLGYYLWLYRPFILPKKKKKKKKKKKNSVINHSSFRLVYGREDQQPFDIAARPTKGTNKQGYQIRILLEKTFVNYYSLMDYGSSF